MQIDQRVSRRHRLELVRRGDKRQFRVGGDLRRDARTELRVRVESCADRGAAQRQLEHMRERVLDVRLRVLELRGVAREFLTQGQRRRVLQMRAADLDDVGEGVRLS